MLEMDARNNITEVSKTSQFGLSQSIRGLAVVGITALVFVAWRISPVDYLISKALHLWGFFIYRANHI